ncbi:MAG TPA: protein kinase, partial [Gemmatimonadaceae bacterium]|nr:protein kinase [Gemmatimonadaceae bacterium]
MAERTAGAPELAELSDEFHVVAEIGRGGTAVVYLAHELALDRRVAIKIIRGRYAGDDELVARLEREARLVARLAHPNVVGLHAVRRLRHGSLALVMQYVDGHTLRDELRRRGALPAARARRVLTDVARALAAAHAHGIVHRDVKPENIHLDHETGRVLLGDFGSATPLDPDSRLTIPGMTIGTPGYMAPELVDGGTATPASDLYSLGLVGWEMLAGQPPWSGTTLFEVLAFRKHGQLAPIDAVRPDVPRSLARAIERAMQGEPAARWDSAAAMATALGGATDRPDAGDALPLDLRPGAAPPARYGDGAPDAPPDLPTLRFVRSTEQRSEEPVAAAAAALPLPLPTGGDPPGAIEAPPSLADAVGADAGEGDAVDEPPDVSSWAAPAGPTSGGAWRRALRPAAVLTVLAGTAAAAALLVNLGRSAPPVGPLATGSDVPPRHEVPVGDVPAPPAGRPSGVATPTAPADPGATTAPAALATGPSGAATADSAPEPADSLLTAAAEHAGSLASVPDPAPPTTPSVREEATPPATSPTAPATRSSAPATPQVGPGPELVRERAGRLAIVPQPAIDRTAPVAPRGRPSPANASESGETAGAIVARTVSAGGMHSCAVLPGSQVRCWGSNDHGQLGSRGAARQVRATPIVAGLELHGLALGLAHSCGLTDDGTALCW